MLGALTLDAERAARALRVVLEFAPRLATLATSAQQQLLALIAGSHGQYGGAARRKRQLELMEAIGQSEDAIGAVAAHGDGLRKRFQHLARLLVITRAWAPGKPLARGHLALARGQLAKDADCALGRMQAAVLVRMGKALPLTASATDGGRRRGSSAAAARTSRREARVSRTESARASRAEPRVSHAEPRVSHGEPRQSLQSAAPRTSLVRRHSVTGPHTPAAALVDDVEEEFADVRKFFASQLRLIMASLADAQLCGMSPSAERRRLAALGGVLHNALTKMPYRVHLRADVLFAKGLRANANGDARQARSFFLDAHGVVLEAYRPEAERLRVARLAEQVRPSHRLLRLLSHLLVRLLAEQVQLLHLLSHLL